MASVTEDLERLAALFREGLLTREEFETQKRVIMSGAGTPTNPQQKRGRGRKEEVFFEAQILDLEGHSERVRITSHRAIIGGKTYSLHNIVAISAYMDEEEVSIHNQEMLRRWASGKEALKKEKEGMCMGALFFIAVGGTCIAYDWCVCGGLLLLPGFLIFYGLWFQTAPPQPVPLKATYTVRIQAAGTSDDSITSYDKDLIMKAVDALDYAIANLNV